MFFLKYRVITTVRCRQAVEVGNIGEQRGAIDKAKLNGRAFVRWRAWCARSVKR